MHAHDPEPAPIDPAELVRAFERLTPEQVRRIRLILIDGWDSWAPPIQDLSRAELVRAAEKADEPSHPA